MGDQTISRPLSSVQHFLLGGPLLLFVCVQAFVHLSTAFCHCDQEELEERAYELRLDPLDVMKSLRWMDETSLNMITDRYAARC
jgi:hypothetical protein